ncbi:hypothetical protein ACFYXM_10810 [Streptomyces sp. NPDC002476]|uniref:hypothetical protein n=1 Tax=Streptomyces sp. NPDC002476 TaxID=3364648 RepID=UPI00368B4A97
MYDSFGRCTAMYESAHTTQQAPSAPHPLRSIYDARRRELESTPPSELLDRLTSMGFSDREVAKVIHRAEDAFERLRKTGAIDEETDFWAERFNRQTQDRLVSFTASCEAIATLDTVPSVSDWFRASLTPAVNYTPLDLADKGIKLELDYAAGLCSVEEALVLVEQWWRGMTSC